MNDARSRVDYRIRYKKPKQLNGTRPGQRIGQKGFTIIETLIVLAVSMALFLAAVILVAGQQRKVEFSQAVRDIQSNIQKTINEVSTGYYSNPGFSCSASSSVTITAGSTPQGSNNGCIFLGKALQFAVNGTDPQAYVTHVIAGLQDNTGTLASARPRAIAPGQATNNAANFPNASTTDVLHNGLRAVSMSYTTGNSVVPIGAVAFLSELGDLDSSTGQLLSGAQNVNVVPINNSASNNSPLSTTSTNVVDRINQQLLLSAPPVNPNGGVQICFASGGTDQSGLVTIGGSGRSLSVKLDIKSTKDCT